MPAQELYVFHIVMLLAATSVSNAPNHLLCSIYCLSIITLVTFVQICNENIYIREAGNTQRLFSGVLFNIGRYAMCTYGDYTRHHVVVRRAAAHEVRGQVTTTVFQ